MTTKKAKPNGTAPTEAAETVLDAKALLEGPTLPVEAVPVPELNGRVHVREMTVGERDEYEARVVDARQGEDKPSGLVRAALLVRVLCDADGQCLFAADQTEQLAKTLGARVGDRLFEVACRLNGIGQKQVEEREKN